MEKLFKDSVYTAIFHNGTIASVRKLKKNSYYIFINNKLAMFFTDQLIKLYDSRYDAITTIKEIEGANIDINRPFNNVNNKTLWLSPFYSIE